MRFGPVPVGEAAGAVAAHGVQARGESGEAVVVRKGDTVTADQTAALERAGVRSIVVAACVTNTQPSSVRPAQA